MKSTRAMVLGVSVAIALLGPAALNAAELELIFNGAFNSQDSLAPASSPGSGAFTKPTPFTINAFFNTNSPDLAPTSPPGPPPFAGFRAYEPTQATITVSGTTYSFETISQNPTAGLTVAIFDQNSFTPGRYAVGILQQPPLDGAGIIADFSGASPDFTAAAIGPTVFTGYNGVGYGSGVCLQGSGANCQLNAVTPFVLDNGQFTLTLGNYEENYPGGQDVGAGGIPGPLNTVELIAVPEPATFGFAALFLVAGGLLRRKLR